jgi:hypothetical protein
MLDRKHAMDISVQPSAAGVQPTAEAAPWTLSLIPC